MTLWKYSLAVLLLTCMVGQTAAKSIQVPHLYMFGFSASFKDSVVYVTDIQDMKGVWIDNKTKFLLSRENYSHQLTDYLANQQQQPNRICMVFYAKTFKKAEKLFVKLKKKYIGTKKNPAHYDMRFISQQEFRFETIDMSPEQQE